MTLDTYTDYLEYQDKFRTVPLDADEYGYDRD